MTLRQFQDALMTTLLYLCAVLAILVGITLGFRMSGLLPPFAVTVQYGKAAPLSECDTHDPRIQLTWDRSVGFGCHAKSAAER